MLLLNECSLGAKGMSGGKAAWASFTVNTLRYNTTAFILLGETFLTFGRVKRCAKIALSFFYI
jgi:hypothetical protein